MRSEPQNSQELILTGENEDELTDRRTGLAAPGSENKAPADLVVPAPEPYGLDTIPPGCRAFFLFHGELNAIYARGYNQPAAGIESWHPEYSGLPAFTQAERIWVVVNTAEDNLLFVASIAADKFIRRRCTISTEDVQRVTKAKMLWEKEHSYPFLSEEFRRWYDEQFERIWCFEAFPRPSEVYKLKKLGAPKRGDDSQFYAESTGKRRRSRKPPKGGT